MGWQRRISPEIEAARQRLCSTRRALYDEHRAGLPGPQIGYRLTELFESLVIQAYQISLCDSGEQAAERVAVVAHSGLGRRDVSPYSDVDVMVVYRGPGDDRLLSFARAFQRNLSDFQLVLGFSNRPLKEITLVAAREPVFLTALIESRFLAGNQEVFDAYWDRFTRLIRRWRNYWVSRIAEARRQEHSSHGDTVYLLCPNVKRSRGGLRDIHLIRWLGFVAYGERDLHRLEQLGVLFADERKRVVAAYEFLLQIRHDLHFHAEKAQDILDRNEQVRLAVARGYTDGHDLLAVEQFMRTYIEHTADVRYAASNFLAYVQRSNGSRRLFNFLFSRRLSRDYSVGPRELWATRRGLAKLRNNFSEVMRLMELAALTGKRISHHTWQQIRRDVEAHRAQAPSDQAIKHFLSLLSCPSQTAPILRRLHELRILEHFVPPMRHARSLLQFNEYHKYTIDEHSIRAVKMAISFAHDPGLLGQLYRAVPHKHILHLALLLHDLGKGYGIDHSLKGAELAEQTCRHLGLTPEDTNTVVRLVRQHLLMAHVALRHDLSNESVVLQFAREVGSVEFLRLLMLLTCADLSAVGPGTFTPWKLDLLTELYYRTLDHLDPETTTESYRRRSEQVRRRLLNMIPPAGRKDWWEQKIHNLPASYLQPGDETRIMWILEQLSQLSRGKALAWGRYLTDRQVVEYTVGTTDDIVPGIFHRLTGVLTSTGHSILAAQIHTLVDELVLDRFFVQDLDFKGEPPPDRIQEICQRLVHSLEYPSDERPAFRRLWRSAENSSRLRVLEETVRSDNSTSPAHTILIVFAYDRVGLLYSITRKLYELGLSVHVAKIATYLDQVVDVFYVTDRAGKKIEDASRLDEIRQSLVEAMQALDGFESV